MADENQHQEEKEERKSVRASVASAVVNVGSTFESTGSDLVQALDDLVKLRVREALKDVGMATTDYVSGMVTATQLGFGRKLSVAPEALNITQEQWHSLHTMIAPLRAWSKHAFPTRMDTQDFDYERDVNVFLAAGRVMTVASALSYAEEEEAQRILDEEWTVQVKNGDTQETIVGRDNWTVKVVEYGAAQAMLFLEKTPNLETDRKPVAVLAFRGTELPDDHASGTRQFVPDWWRNLSFQLTPYHANGDGGSVAEGFLLAWRGICGGEPGLKRKILQELKEYREKHDRKVDLFVTGHSQGGALAAVSLLDLLKEEGHSSYTVCGCLTIAQPRCGDEEHSRALRDIVEKRGIPFDLVANEDVTGVDPVVSLGGPRTKMPVGRFWKVRAGDKTLRPETQDEHRQIVEAPISNIVWRGMTSAPLHWPGGRHGYLAALDE